MSVIETTAGPPPVEEREIVVALHGASKRYGPIQALEGVDLELRAGEVHCLAGENGAGKSTLIKILTGAVQRDAGSYEIGGTDVGSPSPVQARDAGVGVVYQELSLLPDLSVGENLLMGRLPARRGITRPAELRRPAREMLERVGLEWLDPRTAVEETSLATRQLVEIAKVLGAVAAGDHLRRADHGPVGVRDQGAARPHPPAARRGPRDHVRVAPPRGDVRDRRPRHGAARREARRLEADGRVRPRLADRVDGRPQDREALPPRRARDRRAAADARRAPAGRRRDADRPDRPRGRDRRHRRAARLGPHGAAARDLRRRPRRRRAHRGRRRARARPAARARRCAPASGCSPRTARSSACCSSCRSARTRRSPTSPRSRASGRPTAGASAGWSTGCSAASSCAPARGSSRVVALRRQPAEGAARPVAGHARPKVLLFDEPTKGVDVGAKAEIYTVLGDLAAQGLGVVVVSSDLPEVLGLARPRRRHARGRRRRGAPGARSHRRGRPQARQPRRLTTGDRTMSTSRFQRRPVVEGAPQAAATTGSAPSACSASATSSAATPAASSS